MLIIIGSQAKFRYQIHVRDKGCPGRKTRCTIEQLQTKLIATGLDPLSAKFKAVSMYGKGQCSVGSPKKSFNMGKYLRPRVTVVSHPEETEKQEQAEELKTDMSYFSNMPPPKVHGNA